MTPTYARPNPAFTPGRSSDIVVERHVTLGQKHRIYSRYGVPLVRRLRYVIDHLIPLELGGTNDDANLWPQPKAEAEVKDRDEDLLAAAVKVGRKTRARAREELLAKWGPLL